MNNSRYEQGGVVSFLVITIALALLLVGGVVLVKRQGDEARKSSDKVQVATTEQPKQDSTVKTEEKKTDTSEETSEAEPNQGSTSNNPTGTVAPSTHSTPSNPGTQPGATPSQPATTGALPVSGPSFDSEGSASLPSTGIGDVIATAFSLSAVSAGVYAYLVSQKRVRVSALK